MERHLSDQDLVRALDGELGRRINSARVHLESCVRCRTRVAAFEGAIAELARAEGTSIDSELPSVIGPRALLRARLAEFSTRDAGRIRVHWSSGLWASALAVSSIVAVVAVASVLALRHSGRLSEYPQLTASRQGVLPNRGFTPGASRPVSLQKICALAHEEVIKEVSPLQRQRVFDEYGIPSAKSDEYEVDYLIAPGLGGNDDIRNLWPQPYYSATWNAHLKDALEERLHEMVCSDRLELSVAQRAIATDWIAAYQKYVKAPQTRGDSKDL
jgi:hypothetical protein